LIMPKKTTRDPHTHLGTRESLVEQLGSMLCADDCRVALCLIGVDGHEELAQEYGGDFVSQVRFDLARLLSSLLVGKQELFSLGEEFAVLILGDGADLARDIAEMIRQSAGTFTVRTADISARVALSVGVAVTDATGPKDPQSLLRAAAFRLTKARDDGGNRVCA
jgi:diguanylate cyclase (GGDEF)-like protein